MECTIIAILSIAISAGLAAGLGLMVSDLSNYIFWKKKEKYLANHAAPIHGNQSSEEMDPETIKRINENVYKLYFENERT